MFSSLLIPVEFGHEEHLGQILKVAKTLMAEGGKITLLHVTEAIPTYAAARIPDSILKDSHAAAETELANIAERSGLDPAPATQMVTGHAARAIVDAARDGGHDLLLLGSHKPGLEDYFLGSVSAHVVRHAQCSVLVVR